MSVARGILTIRSSGPQETLEGKLPCDSSVMSTPMTAKSPSASARMSGQPAPEEVFAPCACGSGPRR